MAIVRVWFTDETDDKFENITSIECNDHVLSLYKGTNDIPNGHPWQMVFPLINLQCYSVEK